MAAARPREEVTRKARDTVDPRGTGVDSGDTGRDSRQRLIVKPSSRWTKERRFVLTSHFGKQEGQRFYRCTEISSGQQFLLKTVRVDESDEAARWRRDVTSWSQLGHPHILAYRDAWQSLDYQHVLCAPALMPLSELLHAMCPEKPCQRLFSVWLFHILSALQYMHELHEENRPMLYRNVHPDCIVVTDKCCLQLCQFADTKQLDGPHGTTRTVVGQGLFQSPEILQGLPYDKSADIWSAGVVSIFIADYARASKAGSIQKLRQILAESGLRKDLQAVTLRAVQQEPGQRLDASGLISRLSQAVGPELLKAPVPSSLYPSPLQATEPEECYELSPVVEERSHEEEGFADDSRVAVDRKTSKKLFIAAVSVRKRPRSEDSSARIRERERTKTTSEGIGRSAGGKKAFHPDDLPRLRELITFRKERERGGGPWVWGLSRSSKSRQDTELTSGLGDSLPNTGYVCTYCGQLNTGPVELQVLATGNHRLKDQGRHSANVHVHVWDERLLIRDFREQYCMSCRNFQELDKTSLTLTGGIKGSHMSLSLTIFGEQEVRNWHHCRTPDGSPGLPEERVYSVDEVLGCKHAACPAGGSRLRPLEAKWKLESVSPSPPNLWFQCVIDIRHLLPPDSQATPRVAAPAHGRSLSVEMEAARDASFPSNRESQSREPSMQHRFFQDLAHLPKKLPPPHANLPDYKHGSGGGDDRYPHGERVRGEVWNPAKDQARELGKVSDDDSLPSFPSLYERLGHQIGQVALVDHPDHIQPPDPSYPPELHALEADQSDQLIRPLGPPHEHDERSMPRGLCREQGDPRLPSDGSLQRKMNRLRNSLLPYSSVSSSEAGQSPATPHGMSNTAQTRSATPQDKSSTHQRRSSILLPVGSTPQARSTTPHSKSSAQQRCSPTTRDISSTLQRPSPSPHDVSSTHQRRPPTSHGKSSTQQGRSPIPHSVSSTPERSSPTPHDAYSTPQERASSIPHRHHVAQQFTTPHAKNNAQQCSANPHRRPHVTLSQTNFGHDINSGQDVSHSGEANRAPQVSHSGEPNRAPGNQQGDMSAVKDQVAQMMRGAQNNQQLRQLYRLLLEVIPSTSQVSSDSNG
ncbi:hypothetical protein ACOMHN_039958 [Nucella lapillus]